MIFDSNLKRFATITYDNIEQLIVAFSDISKKQIQNKPDDSKKRGRYKENERVTFARQLCHYLSRKYMTNASFKDIGERFGGRNSASVMHSCKTIENLKETDKEGFLYLYLLEQEIEKYNIDFTAIPQY